MSESTNSIEATTALRVMLLVHLQLVRRLIANGVLARADVIADINRLQAEAAGSRATVPELSTMITFATMLLGEMIEGHPPSGAS